MQIFGFHGFAKINYKNCLYLLFYSKILTLIRSFHKILHVESFNLVIFMTEFLITLYVYETPIDLIFYFTNLQLLTQPSQINWFHENFEPNFILSDGKINMTTHNFFFLIKQDWTEYIYIQSFWKSELNSV